MTPGRPLMVAKRTVKSSRHHAPGRLRVASTRNRAARSAPSITFSADLTLPPPSVTTRTSLNVLDGADRAARFLVGVTRKGWREDFTLRFATINGLPGVIVDGSEGPVQTAAFEIEGDVIRALYVVRNPDKLRHLAAASAPHESGSA